MSSPDASPRPVEPPYSEARAADLLRYIAAESCDLLAALDRDYRWLTFNRAYGATFREVFGEAPALGMDLREALAALPEERARVVEVWRRGLAGESFTEVARFGDPARREAVFELSVRPLPGEGGEVVGAWLVARDVTAQEEARGEVERLNAELEGRILTRTAEVEQRRVAAELERTRLRAVLEILPVGVWIADADGRLLETNRTGRTIWGEAAPLSDGRDAYGEDYRAWWPDGRRVRSEEWALARALERGEVSIAEEIQIEATDGRRKTILNYALPIRDEADRIVGGVAVNVDISGRKAEERRQELLAAAGAVLASPLEMDGRLRPLAKLVAERLADIAVIDLFGAGGSTRRIEVAENAAASGEDADGVGSWMESGARDGSGARARIAEVAEWLRGLLPEAPFWRDTARVAEDGIPVLVEDVAAAGSPYRAEAWAALAERLGSGSMMLVPLKAERGVIGALTLLRAGQEGTYGPADLSVAVELADRVALALENVRLFQAAREAVREREEVVALVSHDLRNPLNTIQMAARLLRESGLSPERKDAQREVILRAASQMNRLIQDLLDVTRMGTGTFRVEGQPVDPSALVEQALAMATASAESKGVALEGDVPEGLPTVLADRDRVLQVLSNLVGNAVSFTPEGGRVRVRAADDGGSVRFTVTDTGPGVPVGERASIFQRFWQGTRGSRGGAGLGLSIAKGIVEAHGGSIVLVPEEEYGPGDGPGATFRFDLPVADRAGAGSAA